MIEPVKLSAALLERLNTPAWQFDPGNYWSTWGDWIRPNWTRTREGVYEQTFFDPAPTGRYQVVVESHSGGTEIYYADMTGRRVNDPEEIPLATDYVFRAYVAELQGVIDSHPAPKAQIHALFNHGGLPALMFVCKLPQHFILNWSAEDWAYSGQFIAEQQHIRAEESHGQDLQMGIIVVAVMTAGYALSAAGVGTAAEVGAGTTISTAEAGTIAAAEIATAEASALEMAAAVAAESGAIDVGAAVAVESIATEAAATAALEAAAEETIAELAAEAVADEVVTEAAIETAEAAIEAAVEKAVEGAAEETILQTLERYGMQAVKALPLAQKIYGAVKMLDKAKKPVTAPAVIGQVESSRRMEQYMLLGGAALALFVGVMLLGKKR